MSPVTQATVLKQVSLLKQPLFGRLMRELWSLRNLTQGQFAAAIDISYVTVCQWKASRIQSSELALCQVQAFVESFSQSTSQPIQDWGKSFLHRILPKCKGRK